MAWDNKVIWSEGLFLQPQHFQQNDRYVESLVTGVVRNLSQYGWGFSALALDEDLLRLGKIAIKSCAGITPDGAEFRVPQSEAQPVAFDVPKEIKNSTVYLAVPTRVHGSTEVDMSGSEKSAARYRPEEIEITNTVGNDRMPVTLAVGQMQLHFALDVDDLSGKLVIPLARVIEVRPDGEVVLDRAFIPSCIDARASAALHGFIREVEGLLAHRCEALAGRLSDSGPTKGVAEISDFLLLITVNRYLPQMRHLMGVENVHPAPLYQLFGALAGELGTFMAMDKRAPDLPAYQHDNLTVTWQPVMRFLRQYLSAVLEQTAVSIPIEARKYGISVAMIADKRLLTSATFVIAAKADVAAEAVRRHFPNQAKLGPVESIRQLVNSALPGVGLRPLPVAPRQIPYHSGVVYFELDRDSNHWKQMTTSGGLAIHVAGEFPGLEMELWAIREK